MNRIQPCRRCRWIFPSAFIALVCATTAMAGLKLDLQVVRYNWQENYYYYFAPNLSTNADAPQLPFGTYRIASPHYPTNGNSYVYEFSTNGFHFSNGGGSGNNDFDSLMFAITDGPWTLFATNSTTTNTYHFVVTATGIVSNSLPAALITFPTNNAMNVTNQPTFTWQGPAQFGSLSVFAHDPDYNFYEGASLPPTETSWTIPITLSNGTNDFNVDYRSNSTAVIVATTPTNEIGQAISSWTSTSQLVSQYQVEFTVGLPGSPSNGHTNIAHYAFEDNSVFTSDLSGNGNDINSVASFGGGHVDTTTDAAAGDYAAVFDNNGGSGAGWLLPPAELLSTLARSFSISVWLKTTQIEGNDDDDGLFDGAGIVTAFSGPGPNYVNPLVLTGSKLAFFTGDFSQGTSLHSIQSINSGDWVHVVVTRDMGTGEKRIYINGVLDASEFGTTALLDNPDDLNIGVNNGNGFSGQLDEIQFYSGVLSDDEVLFLYENPDATVPDAEGADFNPALDTTDWTWTTGGDANWFTQTINTYDGEDAAQSGDIDDNEESWIETTVNGPGMLSFWWNVSCEDGFDYFEFLIDDEWQDEITGDWGWEQRSYLIGPGTHTLRWRYYKADCCTDLDDAAFLDQVEFTTSSFPMITRHPFSQTNFPGYQVALLADATGSPAPSWQWFKNGTLIPGATTALFIPTNSGTADVAGNYYALASNSSGSANTHTATVTFVSAPLPPDWSIAFRAPLDNSYNLIVTNYGIAGLVDSAGNVYSANSFTGTNTVASTDVSAGPGKFGTALMKMTSTGHSIWTRAITNDGSGNSYPQCLAPAPGDGVYMSGVFTGTNGLGTNTLTEVGGGATYLTRFASDGTVLWVRTISGTNFSFQSYHQLVSDDAGNVTISALAQDYTSIAGATNVLLNGQRGVLAQFDSNGNLRWASLPSGWCQHLAYHEGRIYATLNGGDTNYIGGLTNTSDRQWALAALNADTGQAIWLRNFGPALGNGTLADAPHVTAFGNDVFLVGTGSGSNATFGTFSISWPVSVGQYFARYDTDGNAQLAVSFGSETTIPWTAVADASGNVFVGGDFDTYAAFDSKLIAAPHVNSIGTGYLSQTFIAKFDRNGSNQWTRIAQSPSFANLRDIMLANDGIWGIGVTDERAQFGSHTVYGPVICLGTPFCTLQYLTGGWIAKITDASAVNVLPVTLINPKFPGSTFRFSFQSQSGVTHTVLYRTNLSSGTWLTNSTIPGDGTLKTVDVPLSTFGGAPQGFIRVFSQ